MPLDGSHENGMFEAGFKLIAGVDEAGRGPLAGPVVAAAVAAGSGFDFSQSGIGGINDSKLVSAKKREKLFGTIYEVFPYISVGIVERDVIDEINILNASLLAMKKAVQGLLIKPEAIFVDGNKKIPDLDLLQRTVIGGDGKIILIAAASIVAKVFRDRIMLKTHECYPQYGFDKHKGYGTRLHVEMLCKWGPSPVHRTSFKPVMVCRKK
jgi:ribonuclease HII